MQLYALYLLCGCCPIKKGKSKNCIILNDLFNWPFYCAMFSNNLIHKNLEKKLLLTNFFGNFPDENYVMLHRLHKRSFHSIIFHFFERINS